MSELLAVTNIWIYSYTLYLIFSGIHQFASLGSKNKSNSQLRNFIPSCCPCCDKYLNFKEQKQFTTAFERDDRTKGCDKYLNFKEQKQFTTYSTDSLSKITLWQISEFQRTKAIHNCKTIQSKYRQAVTNIWISKNKSNSQQGWKKAQRVECCDKYLNFKEQKQFTTMSA